MEITCCCWQHIHTSGDSLTTSPLDISVRVFYVYSTAFHSETFVFLSFVIIFCVQTAESEVNKKIIIVNSWTVTCSKGQNAHSLALYPVKDWSPVVFSHVGQFRLSPEFSFRAWTTQKEVLLSKTFTIVQTPKWIRRGVGQQTEAGCTASIPLQITCFCLQRIHTSDQEGQCSVDIFIRVFHVYGTSWPEIL